MKTSDVGIAQQSVPVIGLRTVGKVDVEAMLEDESTRWYAERRMRALSAAGLLPTTAAGWDAKLHPRGRDGKFIEKFGFVRWIENGNWTRGQVTDITDKGHVIVTKKDGSTTEIQKPSQQLYSLPRPKGVLNLPGGGAKPDDGMWVKTGGQGGSNPGGKYKIMDANAAVTVPTEVDDDIVGRLIEDYEISTDWSTWKTTENVLVVIDTGERDNAKLRVLTRVGNDTDGDPIRLVDAVSGEAIDASTLQRDPQATLFVNNSANKINVIEELASISVQAPNNGDEVYVKNSKSESHAANEMLANRFYELAGVAVPETFVDSTNPKIFGSKILPAGSPISAEIGDINLVKRIQDDIAIDAWLANWDVAGLTLDNITIIDGQPYRIDAGGSMLYRAQGAPKGAKFGNEVIELETFRSKLNPSAAKIFAGTTDAQIKDGVERIAAIKPDKIKDLVSEANLPSSLADTLIARRDWLMKKYKVDEPGVSAVPEVTGPNFEALLPAENLTVVRIFDPALGVWSPQPLGTEVPDVPHNVQQANDLIVEQGDLHIGSNKQVMVGDAVWLNPEQLGEAQEMWNGVVPGAAYTVTQINPSFGAGDDQWRVLNEFTGVEEMISIPSGLQVNQIGNWSDVGDMYKSYGMEGFKGAVNASVDEHENLPKLFSVARANSFFETKPFSLDGYSFKLQPSKRNAVTVPALAELKAENAPKWVAWQSFNGDGSTGGFYIDVNAAGAPVVMRSFRTELDGTYSYEEHDEGEPFAKFLTDTNVPFSATMIELDPYTSIVADAMVSRNTSETQTPAFVTVAPQVKAEADLIHADVPPITAPEGTVSEMPPIDPDIDSKTLGTGINKWTLTEATRDDVIAKLKSMKPVTDPETGKVSLPVLNVIAYKPIGDGGQHEDHGTGPGLSQVSLTPDGQLQVLGGKYLGGYQLNSASYDGKKMQFRIVDSDVDLQTIAVREVTYKQDGTIVNKATGMSIGKWSNDYYYGFTATIDKKFTISGKKETFRSQKKSELISKISVIAVDTTPKSVVNAQPIKKSAETLQVEAIIKSEGPVHTTNGVEIAKGIQVQSLYSGAVGTVDSYDPGETFAVINVIDVNDEASPPIKVVVDVKYLKAVGASLPAQTSKNTSLPAADQPMSKPDVDPSYVGKLYADGSQPKVGQKVLAGSGKSEMTGVIVGFNKENTYVKVKGPEGVKWRAIGVTKLLEQADAKETKLQEQPIDVQVEANAFVPEAEIGIPGTEVPAVVPEGLEIYETVPQTAAQKKFWLDGNPKRQLMKGGLAPAIGMPVRVDDGTPMIIAQMPKSDSASVILYDPKTGKTVSRGAHKLTLDAQKYFGSEGLISRDVAIKWVAADGTVKIENLKAPHGSIVYRVPASSRGAGDTFYFLAPNGNVFTNSVAGGGNSLHAVFGGYEKDSQKREWMVANLFGAEKIGIASDLGTKQIMSQKQKTWYTNPITGEVSVWAPYGDDKTNWVEEKQEGFTTIEEPKSTPAETINEAFAKSKIVSVTAPGTKKYEPPAVVKATPGVLPKPPVDPSDEDTIIGTSPVVTNTGTPELLSQLPSTLSTNPNAKSAKDAVTEVLEARGKKDASSGVRYSLADGDTVEDMSIRFQVVRDAEGNEFMEARFKLLEDKAEEVLDGLTAAHGEKGAWTSTKKVTPVELKEGDTISVRRSSSGLLKPATGDAPNAQVTGTPVLVGKADASGYSLYRVPVVMGDGEYAEMDVELRDSASINVYEWDKNKIVSSKGKVDITPAAVADGWKRVEGMFIPNETGSVQVDPTGVQIIKSKNDIGTNVGNGKRGSTMMRTLTNGVKVRIIGASSNEGGTSHSSSDVRRSSFAGDVRVRVPLPKGEADMDQLLTDMSAGLEAAGLPVEKQEPPDPQQLVKLALNKLYKTHAPKFEHRAQFDATGLPGDPATEKLLADISKRVGLSKEPLTLDDLVFTADSDGRLTVRLSDRAADSITKQQGNTFYTHNLSGSANDRVIEMLSGATTTGLLATEERWSMGIGTTGKSSSTDVSYGSGNGVYATGRTGSKIQAGQSTVIFSSRALNSSLEVYTNTGDGYGKRSGSNTFATSGGNHEYMFKSRLSRDQIAYVTVPDPKKVIAELKKRGVTHVNGRPVEDIVRSSSSLGSVDVNSSEFMELGVVDHIATAGDLAAAAPAPGTNGPA